MHRYVVVDVYSQDREIPGCRLKFRGLATRALPQNYFGTVCAQTDKCRPLKVILAGGVIT